MKLAPESVTHYPNSDRRIHLADGRGLGYAEYGTPDGQPILYFHGGLSSRWDIAFAHPWCCSHGIRLLAVDRPGMGLSDLQPNRRLLSWPNDIVELADTLGLERFALFGWSAGGPYVLACAYQIPHRLTRVGISGGMCPINRAEAVQELGLLADRVLFPLAEQLPWLAALLLKTASYLPAPMLKWILEQELSSEADRKLLAALSSAQAIGFFYEACRSGPQGIVDDYRILGNDWGFKLEDITMEVQLWQGREDYLLPMAHARYLAQHLKFAQLVVWSQGHFLGQNAIAEILTFLSGNSDAPIGEVAPTA